jgi:23S rRNA (uracil1939-C5)-methyltransferase
VSLRTGDDEIPAAWGHVESAIPAYDGTSLKAPAGSFCQANDAINRLLVDYVTQLARPTGMRILELHCGVGNFTVSLAKTAAALVAVESDPAACEACRANVARRGLEARVVRGDANHPPEGRYDVVVLDPPRQGAKELFEDGRALERAARVVYVSCDSATLGRDLRLARNRGFRLDAIMAFDMFPQTAHLETLVRLVR